MRRNRKNASSWLTAAFLLLFTTSLWAGDTVGSVIFYSGVVSAQSAEGKLRLLGIKSDVDAGDILMTERDSYAQIKFKDGSQITLRPGSRMKVEDFRFDESRPNQDNAVFRLIKGGLRAFTGLIGKRGNRDSYRMETTTATIGIRGTHYGALLCQNDCAELAPNSDKPLENGLYVDVAEGAIVVTNTSGAQDFNAGQLGYVRDNRTLPVFLPADPGGIRITPPTAPKDKGAPSRNVECTVSP